MGSKHDSTTKNNLKESPSRKSSMFSSRQRTASTADALNTSLGNVLRQMENFSPSSKKARPDENVPPGRSIFSCKLPMGSTLLPRDGNSATSPQYEREKSLQQSHTVTQDDFWEALRSHYNYLMDEGLIASCREASDELSWEEEGVSGQTYSWSFTEFIQKFNELHDALHKLQSEVVASSESSDDKSNIVITKVVFEKLQLAAYGCKLFKDQGNQLGRRYPDMKDEINRRVVIIANKWEAVQQAINPHKPPPKESGIFQEVAHEMRCLRRWLRELEERLHPLIIQPGWTVEDLDEKYRDQLALQKEIESRGKFVSSLLKRCDQLGEGEVCLTSLGTAIPEKQSSATSGDDPPTTTVQQRPWDAQRFRRVAVNLEKRWHAIWLRSLEWQCILEELIKKKGAGNVVSCLEKSLCEEPLKKYPRLGNDWDEFPWVGKMTHQPLEESLNLAPSPTFSSSSEAGQPISQLNQGASTTDRGVMVGTTGIAQLKAECGGSFGRFEIVQDVGYSSESSTHLSNDEKSEVIRIYSYGPAEKGRTLINEYKVSGDELIETAPTVGQQQSGLQCVTMGKEDLSTMDWQFTSEDEDFEVYPFEDHHPPLRRSPVSHFSAPNRKTLKSELEDVDGSILEAWIRKDQFQSDSENQEVSVLETSAVTLVASEGSDPFNNEGDAKGPEKAKEDSRKRAAAPPAKLDLDKDVVKQGVIKDSSLKSHRVKEWLKSCQDNPLASGVETNVQEEVSEWPVVASIELTRPVGTVVDSSCDASGEYTTNDEDGSNSDGSQGVNESLALSRSGTGSVETVVPLGRTEECASRAVLRSKKRTTRVDRPCSVTELHHLTSQLGLTQLSTSEGALNTLIHSSSSSSNNRNKLSRGSSPPKSKRHSQPCTAQSQLQLSNYSPQGLSTRRSRRHRSRGSLHCSPTSPYAPSSIGAAPGGGPTPSGTSTANTDSGSDGLSPASGLSTILQGILGHNISDSAHYSSSTGGLTSTGSRRHSGSSGSRSNRRRKSSPSSRSTGRRKSSPKTSNLDLTQLKGTLANLTKEVRKVSPELKLNEVLKLESPVPGIEDQSSVSDQVWDGYEDSPYLSEPYSEKTADEDQVKKLLNFGDDYRAFIGSHSDTSSSIGGLKDDPEVLSRNRNSAIISSQDLRDDSDSDSDVEELQHIMGESFRALQFAESSIHQYKDVIPSTESAELLATCQTNLKFLQVIAEHLDSGLGLRNFSTDDLFHLQELISGWEMLQTVVLSGQTNGQQYRDVQLEINELRNKMAELELIANATCKPFLAMSDLEKRISSLQVSLSTLQETKATLLAVNLKVHRLLTEAGLTLSGLKDDITDLYRHWDDVYELSGSQLSELQSIHSIWVRFNQRRSKLIEILESEEKPEDGAPPSPDPYRQLADRSSKSNEAQELLISLHQDARTLEPHLDSPSGVWSTVEQDLEALGARVKDMQAMVAAACRRQSLGEAGNLTLNLAEPRTILPDQQPSPTILEEDEATSSETTMVEETLSERLEPEPTEVKPAAPKRSRLSRIFRASLPIQMAMVLLYCLAWLLEPHCCDALNNLNFSFTPTLRYVKGPPPV